MAIPSSPWSRIQVDHVKVFPVSSTSCQVTVKVLQKLFMSHGLPRVIMSDNATSFMGEEFQKFMTDNGIVHMFVCATSRVLTLPLSSLRHFWIMLQKR
jgi:hypothetical protein